MEVLWLKSQGLTHEAIARLADVSRRSVQRYLDEFLAGGLEQVRRIPWKGKANELAAHQGSLEDHFVEHPPRSTREAQTAIERETGVRRGLTQVRAFLKNSRPALAEGRHHPGQSGPGGAGRLPEDQTPTPPASGRTGRTYRPVRRCRSLRLRTVPRLPLVPGPPTRSRSFGPEAL
jgi:transposase